MPRADLRDRQPQILAQGLACIVLAEQAAALEFRHDEAHEVLVGAGNVGRGNDETVAGALDEPLLEPIGNLLGAIGL